jgi:uncharacterized sulfatase
MDERYDLVRAARDRRYVYIRHYMPHKIYGQFVSYMFETPTTRIWKERYDRGLLEPPQSLFWQTKPVEELYDLQSDPDETRNLAQSPDHREILERLRRAQASWVHEIRDLGFLPEDEIHSRSLNSTPFEMGRDPDRFAITNVIRMAELASKGGSAAEADLRSALTNSDSAVRYWAAMGSIIRGNSAVTPAAEDLRRIMANDASPSVRVLAAEALAKFGAASDLTPAMRVLVDHGSAVRHSVYVAMLALNAIDDLDAKAKPWAVQIRALPADGNKDGNARTTGYVPRLLEKILDDLEPVGR